MNENGPAGLIVLLDDLHPMDLSGAPSGALASATFITHKRLWRHKKMWAEWKEAFPSNKVVSAEAFLNDVQLEARVDLHNRYFDILEATLDDRRTLMIADRIWAPLHEYPNSSFLATKRISALVWNVVALISEARATALICAATPHLLLDWLIAKACEALQIPIYVIARTPIPWRYWVLDGLKLQQSITLPTPSNIEPTAVSNGAQLPTSPTQHLLTTLSTQKYDQAIELKESSARSRRNRVDRLPQTSLGIRAKYLWANLRKNGARGIGLQMANASVRRGEHRRNLSAYQTHSRQPDLNQPYVALFLHYQPERTSLPEGGAFANQLLAVFALAESLPEGWTLYVKEHPATFWGPPPFNAAFRRHDFYATVASIPRTTLVPEDFDTFDLLDGAQYVATTTGSVGFQALCRGKNVITFGHAAYMGAPGVISLPANDSVRAVSQLKARLSNRYVADTSGLNPTALREYVLWLERASSTDHAGDRPPGPEQVATSYRTRGRLLGQVASSMGQPGTRPVRPGTRQRA